MKTTRQGSVNFRRMIPVMRKETLHIVRDARSLAIVVLAPVVMLFLYGYAITFDIRKVDLGVVDNDRSALSRSLVEKFTSSGYFEVRQASRDDLRKNITAMRVDKVKLILVIPGYFSRDIKRNREVAVQVLADGSDANTTNVALGYARRIVSSFSGEILLAAVRDRGFNPRDIPSVEPVPRVWYNPDLKSVNFIVPGLIAIIMMLIAALLTSLTVVREKERGTFEQLISTPIKPLELMAGKLIPYIVIGMVDVAIIVAAAVLWFHVPFRGNLFTLLLFSLLFLFCAQGLGLLVSSIASSQQAAVIGTLFVTALPSVLLSGFVFPIESMPAVIRVFTYVVPARYFLTALRSLFLKADVGIGTLYTELLYLFFFGMLFMAISARRFKKYLE
ncbi:MAG: ABC transporter permease [Endomicrobiales bacterium]